jgi:hypothetical protein
MDATKVRIDLSSLPVTAMIAGDDSVWVAMRPRWWDLATWLWWWLTPSERKARVQLLRDDGVSVRCYAVCLSKRHIRIAGRTEW